MILMVILMSKLKKQFFVLFYVFIIFNSMLPNTDNTKSLKNLNTIIPGINKHCEKKYINEEEKEYSFKLLELLKEIF